MSTLRKPGRRGAPEHRLDVLTLARRIGSLGTGLTVATILALCAIVENAVAPGLIGHPADTGPVPSPTRSGTHKPDHPRPAAPAGKLTKAVDRAVTKRLAAAARTAYGRSAAPRPVVRFGRHDRDRRWAFGSSVLPAPARSGAVPEAALFVAHRGGRACTVGVDGTATFRRLVARAPSTILPRRRTSRTVAAAASIGSRRSSIRVVPA